MKYLKDMTYSEVRSIEEPTEVLVGGIRKTITCVIVKARGGLGMGEYPEYCFVVLNDGTVWANYEWKGGEWRRVDFGKES